MSFRDSLYRLRAAAECTLVPGLPARSHQHCCSAARSWEPANNSSPAAKSSQSEVEGVWHLRWLFGKWGKKILLRGATTTTSHGSTSTGAASLPPQVPAAGGPPPSLSAAGVAQPEPLSLSSQHFAPGWKSPWMGFAWCCCPFPAAGLSDQNHLSPKHVCEGLCEVCAMLNRSYQGLCWDSNDDVNRGWTTFIKWWCNLIKCTGIAFCIGLILPKG